MAARLNNCEEAGKDNEGRQGRSEKATDNGTGERCSLLASFTEAKGHREHASHHREAGHENGTKAALGALDSGGAGFGSIHSAALGKSDEKDGVGHGHADRHDSPHERLDINRGVCQPESNDDTHNDSGSSGENNEGEFEGLKIGGKQQEDYKDSEEKANAQPLQHFLKGDDLAANCRGNLWRWLAKLAEGSPDLFCDRFEVRAKDIGCNRDHTLHVVALVLADRRAFGDFRDISEKSGIAVLQ